MFLLVTLFKLRIICLQLSLELYLRHKWVVYVPSTYVCTITDRPQYIDLCKNLECWTKNRPFKDSRQEIPCRVEAQWLEGRVLEALLEGVLLVGVVLLRAVHDLLLVEVLLRGRPWGAPGPRSARAFGWPRAHLHLRLCCRLRLHAGLTQHEQTGHTGFAKW